MKEFYRGQWVTGDFKTAYNSDFILEIDKTIKDNEKPLETLKIDRDTALKEINAIMYAINQIKDKRQRQILILRYIDHSNTINSIMTKIKRKDDKTPIKRSQFFLLSSSSLIEFAKHFRGGILQNLR